MDHPTDRRELYETPGRGDNARVAPAFPSITLPRQKAYRLLRSLLFQLPPELAHRVTLEGLERLHASGLLRCQRAVTERPVNAMGLCFPNPVGLAAGLDKDARHVEALAALGFGFIEVGTVTPLPQPGSPSPRLFRLPKREALINRMGFNSEGLERVVRRLKSLRLCWRGILGVNLGLNRDTPPEEAAAAFAASMGAVQDTASYITLNLSSPNTPGLRELQEPAALDTLLEALSETRLRLVEANGRRVPLAVKLSPDTGNEDLRKVAAILLHHEVDGVIATNTTTSRRSVTGLPHAGEKGGLSGAPLGPRALECTRILSEELGDRVTIIASGGIADAAVAAERAAAGARLVQLYTGLIYRGPGLVREVAAAFVCP